MPDLYELYRNLKEVPYIGFFVENYGLSLLAGVLTVSFYKAFRHGRKVQIKDSLENKLK